jgi:hypothetical protein
MHHTAPFPIQHRRCIICADQGKEDVVRRWFLILLTGGALVVTSAASALADAVYHSHHYALVSVNSAPLRSGFVENIHVNGPNIAAHEQYVLNGAEPTTTYQVELLVYFGDPSCSTTPMAIPSETLATNRAGNASGYHVFTPADADGLSGTTFGVNWLIMSGSEIAYQTGCEAVQLD